tara:strand:- start:857 stop:1123 length:267 start_codon:yes stop_codon:yes gene_type:complete
MPKLTKYQLEYRNNNKDKIKIYQKEYRTLLIKKKKSAKIIQKYFRNYLNRSWDKINYEFKKNHIAGANGLIISRMTGLKTARDILLLK